MTKEEVVKKLIEDIKNYPEYLEEFINTKFEDLILYHSSLGRSIRNVHIHCPEEGEELEFEGCPDEASFEIIQMLYNTLKESK